MEEPRPILYGVSDYALMRKKNAWFVDRTAKIRNLEKVSYAVFLRPRRFGKSLFCSILEAYYDIDCADRFEELFSGTDIGANPTEERNRYLVIRFDFSSVDKDAGRVQSDFDYKFSLQCDFFARKYRARLREGVSERILAAPDGGKKLSEIMSGLRESGRELCIIVDEYDNFTNTILAESGLNAYNDLCHGDGFFKQFFAELKALTTALDAPSVANTTLVLNFFDKLVRAQTWPDDYIDENLRTGYAKIRHLVTLNRRLNGNFRVLETLMETGTLSERLIRSFQAKELSQKENFTSLLYWLGITTITGGERGRTRFGIPNETLKRLAAKMIPDAYADIHQIDGRVLAINDALVDFSFDGTWRKFTDILAEIVKENFRVRDSIDGLLQRPDRRASHLARHPRTHRIPPPRHPAICHCGKIVFQPFNLSTILTHEHSPSRHADRRPFRFSRPRL